MDQTPASPESQPQRARPLQQRHRGQTVVREPPGQNSIGHLRQSAVRVGSVGSPKTGSAA